MLDLEPYVQEMMDSHDLQWGDALGLLYHYLMIHYPGAREQYDDGSVPVYWYGHKKELKK